MKGGGSGGGRAYVCVCVWSVCGCEERGVVAGHMCVMGVEVTECVCVCLGGLH